MPNAVTKHVESILETGGMKARDLAQLMATSPETVSRWRSGLVEPQTERLQRLLVLEYIVSELADFYEPQEARLWLFAPHKLLGGESPAARIVSGKLEDVTALIAQLRDGAYA
jgi:transcriptional regulator with XRE-family HTH domain